MVPPFPFRPTPVKTRTISSFDSPVIEYPRQSCKKFRISASSAMIAEYISSTKDVSAFGSYNDGGYSEYVVFASPRPQVDHSVLYSQEVRDSFEFRFDVDVRN